MPLPPAIFLMGPTASGKTALAVELVQRGHCEIISVDSGMVYRGMNIGTAKPEAEVLARAPHHLIDIREPESPYSAAMFREDALALMQAIVARGRIPLLVGGTMLYFRVLRDGLAVMPDANPAIRLRLEQEAAVAGWPALHARLQTVDAETAERLKPNDRQRLQRALEVWELTGKPLSAWHRSQQALPPLPYTLKMFALAPAMRSQLHERIALRFQQMLNQGFVEEVETLRLRPTLSLSLPAMKAVGYRQVWEYLEGLYDAEEMRERAMAATRQLAKRQFTWLRSFGDVQWLDSDHKDLAGQLLKKVL